MAEVPGLTLGAAQLGMDYGVANKVGKMSETTALDFLDKAVSAGITSIDTSPHYGDSERLIGLFAAKTNSHLKITTKLPSLASLGELGRSELRERVRTLLSASLERLNVSAVEHYLVHSEPDFLKYGEDLVEAMADCRSQGLCRNIGVSVYSPQAALKAIAQGVDTLQLPCNILDQRFDLARIPDQALKTGVSLFARSAYLQGLLFLDPQQVRKWLPEAFEPLQVVRQISSQCGRSIAELAFVYVRDHAAICSVVIGMESDAQLAINCKLMQADPIPDVLREHIADQFKAVPEFVVNPSLWRKP